MIEIVEAQESWAAEQAALVERLARLLGPLALRVDPIGSTAVPGLAAKDILDVQVGLASMEGADEALARLAAHGFLPHATIDRDHVPPAGPADPAEWRKRYVLGPEGERPMHVHLREVGRANWRFALLVRDYLRAHAPARQAYETLKRRLAAIVPGGGVYSDVKDPVCDLILDAAEAWAARTDWDPR